MRAQIAPIADELAVLRTLMIASVYAGAGYDPGAPTAAELALMLDADPLDVRVLLDRLAKSDLIAERGHDSGWGVRRWAVTELGAQAVAAAGPGGGMKPYGGYRLTARCDTCSAFDTAWLIADVDPQQLGSMLNALTAGWAEIHSGHEQMVSALYERLVIGAAG